MKDEIYKHIVPEEVGKRLKNAAGMYKASQFVIADCASEVVNHVRGEQKEGRLKVPDFMIWDAISRLCGKSGNRVKMLYEVGQAFPYEIREKYELEFGYFERAMSLNPNEREGALEFVGFYEGEYGRKLGVEEFIARYRQLILGEQALKDVEPEAPPVWEDGEEVEYSPPNILAKFSGWLFEIRQKAAPKQDKPAIQRLMLALDMLEESLPDALVELGYMIDKRVDVEVE